MAKPTYTAFVVTGEGESANWTEIGAGWLHEDGKGVNVVLKAAPLTGKLVLRVPKQKGSS